MEMSEQINEITAALSSVTTEIRDVTKDTKGFNYKYAAIDSYLSVARPLLGKYGLALIQSPSAQGDTVTVTSMLSHTSGQWIRSALTMPVEISKGLSMAQCMGMVITYARRYSLAAMLGMSAEDSDASVAEVEPVAKDALGDLLKAIETADNWAVLSIAQDQQAYRFAFGRLGGKQKSVCRELEQSAATQRADYVTALTDFSNEGDELGAQQLVAELPDVGKKLVWSQLDSNTKNFLKTLKKEAA